MPYKQILRRVKRNWWGYYTSYLGLSGNLWLLLNQIKSSRLSPVTYCFSNKISLDFQGKQTPPSSCPKIGLAVAQSHHIYFFYIFVFFTGDLSLMSFKLPTFCHVFNSLQVQKFHKRIMIHPSSFLSCPSYWSNPGRVFKFQLYNVQRHKDITTHVTGYWTIEFISIFLSILLAV